MQPQYASLCRRGGCHDCAHLSLLDRWLLGPDSGPFLVISAALTSCLSGMASRACSPRCSYTSPSCSLSRSWRAASLMALPWPSSCLLCPAFPVFAALATTRRTRARQPSVVAAAAVLASFFSSLCPDPIHLGALLVRREPHVTFRPPRPHMLLVAWTLYARSTSTLAVPPLRDRP